jgi:hypothetical protein
MEPRERRPDWHDPDFWRWALEHCKGAPAVLEIWFPETGRSGWQHRRLYARNQFRVKLPTVGKGIISQCAGEPPDGWPERPEETGSVPDDVQAQRPRDAERTKARAERDAIADLLEGMPEDERAAFLIERDKTTVRLKRENGELKSKNKLLMREQTLSEELVEIAERLLPRQRSFTPRKFRPRAGKHIVESAVLGWADWHSDEIVDLGIMEGLNEYNPAVMARRVQATTDATLSLLYDHHSGTDFDCLYILDLGDNVTGPLHEENKYTNAMQVFEAIDYVAEIKAKAIAELARQISHVFFIGVPGNHWRYTPKVSWKMPTETSDWLIYRFLAVHCQNMPNVTINVPSAWSANVDIKGHGFALNHGYTDAKGGFGGISWYSLLRSDSKRTGLDQRLGRKTMHRVYGHMHQDGVVRRMGGAGTHHRLPVSHGRQRVRQGRHGRILLRAGPDPLGRA